MPENVAPNFNDHPIGVKVGPEEMEGRGQVGRGRGDERGGGGDLELLIRHLVLGEVAAKQVREVPG